MNAGPRRFLPPFGLRGWTMIGCVIVLGGWYVVNGLLPEVLERHRLQGCLEQSAKVAEILGAQRTAERLPVLRTRAALVRATGFAVHQILGHDCNPDEVAIGVDAADIVAGPAGRDGEFGEIARERLAAIYERSGFNRGALLRALRADQQAEREKKP